MCKAEAVKEFAVPGLPVTPQLGIVAGLNFWGGSEGFGGNVA